MTNALTVFKGQLEEFAPSLAESLPPGLSVERFKRVTMTAVQTNPAILKAAPRKLFLELQKCAQDGLLPDGRQAAIVVYGDEPKYMPMVQGIVGKLRASGAVTTISAAVVYEADEFELELGLEQRLVHRPYFGSGDRGEVRGAYAIARLPNGGVEIEPVTEPELQAIRKISRAKRGPWDGPFADEMRKKSALRRISKRLNLPDDVRRVIERDDDLYDLDLAAEPAPDEPANVLQSIAARARGDLKMSQEPGQPGPDDHIKRSVRALAAAAGIEAVLVTPEMFTLLNLIADNEDEMEAREAIETWKELNGESEISEKQWSAVMRAFDVKFNPETLRAEQDAERAAASG